MTGGLIALTFDDGPDPEITPQCRSCIGRSCSAASSTTIRIPTRI